MILAQGIKTRLILALKLSEARARRTPDSKRAWLKKPI